MSWSFCRRQKREVRKDWTGRRLGGDETEQELVVIETLEEMEEMEKMKELENLVLLEEMEKLDEIEELKELERQEDDWVFWGWMQGTAK